MKVDEISKKSLDEIKNQFREYLHSLEIGEKTVMTVLNDTFYLWKYEGRELFFDKILSSDFELVYRQAMLEALSKHSKGNPVKIVNPYISSARKFRKFLECNEWKKTDTVIEHKADVTKKENHNIPRPCAKELEEYLRKWDKLEHYHLQENALDKLFLDICPNNKDISDILIKVATLNDFYSTNIYSVYAVASHILNLDIDIRVKAGDVTLVSELQRVNIKGTVKNFYSFATKYCSHHNPLEYPIYDSYVEKVLKYFRDLDVFSEFKNKDLKDYIKFKSILVDFKNYYHLENYNLKQIDKYIWQLGKEYFRKKYV